jgi:hydroxymethylbilane synthase
MPPGLELGAVLQREDPRDVLIARGPVTLEDLPQGARVGTSSLRRRAFLSAWRPDLTLLELRGNVPTRIEKLEDGRYEAIVLAAAGVKRLGLEERISSYLPFERFLPAVSQGAIGVQIRTGDRETAAWVGSLDHEPTRMATTAERAFLRTVEGGCHAPVGAFGTLDGETLHLRGMVSALDGSQSVSGEISGPAKEAHSMGVELARDILNRGGEEILTRIGRAGSGD